MRVVAAPEVGSLVRENGGRLFVWTYAHRCCGGGVTLLETGWEARHDKEFRKADADGFELWFHSGGRPSPDELHLELKGRGRHQRVEAFWDGCVFAL